MSAACSSHGCHLSGVMEDAYCPECKLAAYRAVEATARDDRNSHELVGIAFRNAMRRLDPVDADPSPPLPSKRGVISGKGSAPRDGATLSRVIRGGRAVVEEERFNSNCACADHCGDVPEDMDSPLAVCKGLPPIRTVWLPPVRLNYEPRPAGHSDTAVDLMPSESDHEG